MADYCTTADVKALAGAALTTDDALIATLITRATRLVDVYTGRSFSPVTATRYYTPGADTCGPTLFLDADLISVTTLTNVSVIPSIGYTLAPLNASAKSRIILKSSYSWTYTDDPEGAIAVAGSWGYAATVPADIIQATARLALWLYRQREAPFSKVGNAITGDYEVPVAIPDDVRGILDRYRRLAWGAA